MEEENNLTQTSLNQVSQMSSNQKGYILSIIGVILLILVIGVVAYYLGITRNNIGQNNTPITRQNNFQQSQSLITTSPSSLVNSINSSQSVQNKKFAFIRYNNLWFSINGQEKQITSDANYSQGVDSYPIISYHYPSLSPNGNKIVFFKTILPKGSSSVTSLYIVNTDGSGMKVLVENSNFERTYKVQWLNDNQNILIELQQKAPSFAIALVQLNTLSGDQKQLTTYTIQTGCGGGSDDPSLLLSGAEGSRPVYSKIFQISSDNTSLIHNTSCTGYGVNIYNIQRNQDQPLSNNITQAIFSPDGTKIAGISKNNQILIFNTKTASLINTINVSEQPEVLYWSSDEKAIFYGTDSLINNLTAKDSLGNTLNGNQNKASLWSVSADGTNNKKIQDFDVYNVKPLYISQDLSSALLAEVENPTKYFNALNQGFKKVELDFEPTVNIVYINLSTGATTDLLPNATESVIR